MALPHYEGLVAGVFGDLLNENCQNDECALEGD